MANLLCPDCGATQDLPKIGEGTVIMSDKDDTKLMNLEDSKEVDMPKHCGKSMKYIPLPPWAVLSR